jgi:hypothetical protein
LQQKPKPISINNPAFIINALPILMALLKKQNKKAIIKAKIPVKKPTKPNSVVVSVPL